MSSHKLLPLLWIYFFLKIWTQFWFCLDCLTLKMKALKFFKMSGMTRSVAQPHIPEELNYQNVISVLQCVGLLSILWGRKHVIKCWLVSIVTCCYTQLQFIKVFCLSLQNQTSWGVCSGSLQVRVLLIIPPFPLHLPCVSCFLNHNADPTLRCTMILEGK